MSEVEIRTLRPDEVEQFVDLSYYAFYGLDGATREDRAADYRRQDIPERHALVAVEDGRVVAEVVIFALGTWIRGVRYPTGGIANVATAPQKVRRGHARRLLEHALAYMRDELGLWISTLYPTVYPLYHRLGWAIVEDSHRYVGAPSAFEPAAELPRDPSGSIEHRAASLDDLETLEPLYRDFVRGRSGYLDRPRWYWEDHVLRHRRAREPRWLALWHGSDGRPEAYLLYTLNFTPQERLIRVYELVATRPEGYHGLLGFLSAHNLWDKVAVEDSHDVPWRLLVRDPHHLEIQTPTWNNHFLLRVVDLAPAIRAIPASPRARAQSDVTLEVRDPAAPWNDGVWWIGPRDDRWSCERAPAREPRASADIATLAALLSGSTSVHHARDVGLLRGMPEEIETLDELFRSAYAPHSKDHF